MIRSLAKATIEATIYFAIGVGACVVHYRSTERITEFACRWEGECHGWTRALVLSNAIGNLVYWWAYCGISTALIRFHPTLGSMVLARWTVRLAWAFVLTCGTVHLLSAYENFNPIYRFHIWWVGITGPISFVAYFFVCVGLIRTFQQVLKQRARLAELERGQ